LEGILSTPISPELLPVNPKEEISQITENDIGPYELNDFFLFHTLRHGSHPDKILFLANIAFNRKYNQEIIRKWLRKFYERFFSQQFKRNCVPDGPKVGSVSLSPRGDWRMPSDADVFE
jgi:NAD+ synthase (glutamine-hydrolysing)